MSTHSIPNWLVFYSIKDIKEKDFIRYESDSSELKLINNR